MGWLGVHGNESLGNITCIKFVEKLSFFQIHKDSASCRQPDIITKPTLHIKMKLYLIYIYIYIDLKPDMQKWVSITIILLECILHILAQNCIWNIKPITK
jgi:hypothetical protein